MKAKRAVIDTNVLISAALSPQGTAAKITRFFVGQGRVLFSAETFAEFQSRLYRPKFDSYISVEKRKSILGDFGAIADWVEITGKGQYSRDPDDDKFVETALAGRADVLVSGDSDLLVLGSVEGIPILSPSQCLQMLV